MVVLLFMVSVCANEKIFYFGGGLNSLIIRLVVVAVLRVRVDGHIGPMRSFGGSELPLLLYQQEVGLMFILLMLVLVLCLIRVVKISKAEIGPLVKRLYFNSLRKTLY